MRVERLDIFSLADRAQVHGNTPGFDGEFLGGVHQFSSEAVSLLPGFNAEEAKVHAVAPFFEINATYESPTLFKNQELAGAEVFQCAFVVDAIAADEWAFYFKRSVDEPSERISVRVFCDAKRRSDSCRASRKDRATGKFRRAAEFFFDAKQLIVFGDTVGAGSGAGFDLARPSSHG